MGAATSVEVNDKNRRNESPLFKSAFGHRPQFLNTDLVDQLFNSSEERLARILLLMAEFGKPGERETFIPPITQVPTSRTAARKPTADDLSVLSVLLWPVRPTVLVDFIVA
jgi:hypothetical protein